MWIAALFTLFTLGPLQQTQDPPRPVAEQPFSSVPA